MATITMNFAKPLNESLQIGDTCYYISEAPLGGFDVSNTAVTEIGLVILIDPVQYVVKCTTNVPAPPNGAFIFFSKDNKANMSNMLGYYAKVRMRNNSNEKFELFKVNADYTESSK